MAYSTPRTWVTGELVTAAELNQEIRDNINAVAPLGAGAWTSFVPTLTQGASVANTVAYAKYFQIGKLTIAQVKLNVTGVGTATTNIGVTLPVPFTASGAPRIIGDGWIYDASANSVYKAIIEITSTQGIFFRPTTTTANDFLGSAAMTAALASGDLVTYSAIYEAS